MTMTVHGLYIYIYVYPPKIELFDACLLGVRSPSVRAITQLPRVAVPTRSRSCVEEFPPARAATEASQVGMTQPRVGKRRNGGWAGVCPCQVKSPFGFGREIGESELLILYVEIPSRVFTFADGAGNKSFDFNDECCFNVLSDGIPVLGFSGME